MLVMLAYDTPEQRHQNFLRKEIERMGGCIFPATKPCGQGCARAGKTLAKRRDADRLQCKEGEGTVPRDSLISRQRNFLSTRNGPTFVKSPSAHWRKFGLINRNSWVAQTRRSNHPVIS
jgi:hypothetical protein